MTLPLTESSWSNAAQLYCQTETFATRAAYREEGLALTDDLNLPEDHLGISLEFLAYLLEKGKNDRARLFLSEHRIGNDPCARRLRTDPSGRQGPHRASR